MAALKDTFNILYGCVPQRSVQSYRTAEMRLPSWIDRHHDRELREPHDGVSSVVSGLSLPRMYTPSSLMEKPTVWKT